MKWAKCSFSAHSVEGAGGAPRERFDAGLAHCEKAQAWDEILQERVSSSKRKMSHSNLRPRKRQRTRRIDISARLRIVK
jgi:hypothetical protein